MGAERQHLDRCMEQPLATGSTINTGSVSLEAEVPEVLLDGLQEFLSRHPHQDQMGVIRSALATFLFQNGCQDRLVSQHYLDGLFGRS
jgi:hypothetical protein